MADTIICVPVINCIIIDDEFHAIDVLTDHVRKISGLNLMATFNSPLKAVSAIEAGLKPDLVFLDITMPDLSGIELAALLPPASVIIYVTAHPDFALKAFETNGVDYLLKPVSFNRLIKSFHKVQKLLTIKNTGPHTATDHFFVNAGSRGKMVKLIYGDIIHIKAQKNYVVVHVSDGTEHVSYLTMSEIEDALPADQFLRIHKSSIINLSKILYAERTAVIMYGQTQLPLGNSYKDKFFNYINNLSVISKRSETR